MSLVSVSGGSKLLSPLLVIECVVYELSPHELVICRRLSIIIIVVCDVEHLPLILNSLQNGSPNLGSVIMYFSQGPGFESRIPDSTHNLAKCHNSMECTYSQLCADVSANGISELAEILQAEQQANRSEPLVLDSLVDHVYGNLYLLIESLGAAVRVQRRTVAESCAVVDGLIVLVSHVIVLKCRDVADCRKGIQIPSCLWTWCLGSIFKRFCAALNFYFANWRCLTTVGSLTCSVIQGIEGLG